MMNRKQKAQKILDVINPNLVAFLQEDWDELVPDFTENLINTAYGDIYSREGVDLKTRQLATLAALTAMGGQTAPQLKVNIKHALKAGANRKEVTEVIYQMSLYGGMPAAINGLRAAKEVFAELDGV
ncbi:MAG: carboxymuconolactone decarboxylase family protein [OCS116 cluster bacterium]|uniref:Carboxymuconolactone decarboxylase-like domain-containing protein n=1 Tax=OCS116 cluster bacterium TaxID=2030921 RepID=A0A2A4Z595_9PROT|nr:carboxymuconolactone decarboxylase family protein [OCS116 cluster bacterium]